MEVSRISALDLHNIQQVLSSNRISDSQKVQFLRKNSSQISRVIETQLTAPEFKGLMEKRPLIKFKPIKNSFTKRGDKILLAKTLGIPESDVDEYIKNVIDALDDINQLSFLPKDKIDAMKTYVYRHGSKDDIVTFLNIELTESKDKLKTLYRTLEYHTGGLADYFIRPIHRLDNKTMVKIYNIIDKNIDAAYKAGDISEEDRQKIAKWTLVKIFRIQNNNKLINAIKTYKTLKS